MTCVKNRVVYPGTCLIGLRTRSFRFGHLIEFWLLNRSYYYFFFTISYVNAGALIGLCWNFRIDLWFICFVPCSRYLCRPIEPPFANNSPHILQAILFVIFGSFDGFFQIDLLIFVLIGCWVKDVLMMGYLDGMSCEKNSLKLLTNALLSFTGSSHSACDWLNKFMSDSFSILGWRLSRIDGFFSYEALQYEIGFTRLWVKE